MSGGILHGIKLDRRLRRLFFHSAEIRFHDGNQHREKGIEDNQGSQRSQEALIIPLDIVPNHITGTKQQMDEGAFGVVVEKGDAVKRAFGKASLT